MTDQMLPPMESPRGKNRSHQLTKFSDRIPALLSDQNLPNGRTGIEAKNARNQTIWLTRCIAKKLYICARCTKQITIGQEHSLVRVQNGRSKFGHHHLHKQCSYLWINFDKPYSLFNHSTQFDRRINKRQARSRAKRRRRRQ